ncbi:MAG: mismatch repair protein MutS [Bacteroidales bacterium]|nr:mismatch repair protein MutS [Bacteroidales bacterium]MDN5329169.1 mismatch repair protein MutS [Bacteroidales bacterium]
MKGSSVDTPLMKQYSRIKAKYPDALLLFRVGDFYETFGEDAIKASQILGIVLTKRSNGAAATVDLAGFPYHALDNYLPKLVRAGLRVAICDQLEDPKLAKTIVKRGVTELVTPGVSINDKILEQKENNFLASIHFGETTSGISFLDISTGEFLVAQGNIEYIDKLLQNFRPSEIILQKNKLRRFIELFGDKFYTTTFDDWVFTEEFANDLLLRHFQVSSLKGFGVDMLPMAVVAAGAALHYLAETQHDKVGHLTRLSRIEEDKYVWLDRFTIRNLELLQPNSEGARTLLQVLDHTITPMGARLLRRWITMPLKERKSVEERLEIVTYFLENKELAAAVGQQLKTVGDLERLTSKISVGKATPREVLYVARALESVREIASICLKTQQAVLMHLAEQLNPLPLIYSRITKTLQEDPPPLVSKGNVIAKGVSPELDELREMLYEGKDYLAHIQQREIQATGITSLKIGFNNVFGYYIEVTNAHKNKVPSTWHRKQTLVNAERYITDELKEYEQKILGAEEKILELESRIFNELLIEVTDYVVPLQLNASILARLDVLLNFANLAAESNYCRPKLSDSIHLEIKEGRHPVIEKMMPPGEQYVPNDLTLNPKSNQIIILTGPNMSGKSALLRQTALIVLMAQMGSFVPAAQAHIGIVDKIFTRVGASDNISSGESTFMVEMNETASILNNISDRSLIILDEIGRGTSTYDGISIAWSIVEYLHEHPIYHPKVLFATHYHELNEMARLFPRVKNFHVSVREIGNRVIFLRKLAPGGSEHSFGIHVARMAGMPKKVVERAAELLETLEQSRNSEALSKAGPSLPKSQEGIQLSFFQLDDPLLLQIKEEINNIDIDTLTPIEALMKLHQIKKLLGGK